MHRSALAVVAAGALVVTGSSLGTIGATAAPAPVCGARTNNTSALLEECVTLAGVREHQAAFQDIADANGSTRVSGSPGYDVSVDYVVDRLHDRGWNVTPQAFEFQTFVSLSPSVLEQVAPAPARALAHSIMSYSGSGDVTAAVSRPTGDCRGCSAADFTGFPAGNIALVSARDAGRVPRCACTFALKAAERHRRGCRGTHRLQQRRRTAERHTRRHLHRRLPGCGHHAESGRAAGGDAWSAACTSRPTRLRGTATTENVLAELPGKNANNVVMAGAHLDSVNAGPGINDNGSGSAALLEVAENLGKVKPQNTLRLAWWAAEESSLVGSTYYVNNLATAERQKIALYLNFDMVGSPNHVFFIYDGDDSDAVGAGPGPAGSAQIEKTFEQFFTSRGLPYKGTDFSGRSDYGPFIAVGIPSGGLFTGAEGIKTRAGGSDSRRHRRRGVRPLLPPGLRHLREQQRRGAGQQQRRDRAFGDQLRR